MEMDAFEEFLNTHPLSTQTVGEMYEFIHNLRELEGYETLTLGGLMDIIVMYYE